MRLLVLACVFLSCFLGPAQAEEAAPTQAKARDAAPALGSKLVGISEAQANEDRMWRDGRLIKGKVADGKVAFTFDDGPDPATTPLILDALEAAKVPATFFVVGRRFASQKSTESMGTALLSEIASRGFTVGNHTSTHYKLSEQNFKAGSQSIERNAADLEEVLGFRPRLFRPPFGAITSKFKRLLRQRGDTLVMWSIDSKDFQRSASATLRERVVRQILNNDGGVVLLHDTKPWTARALPGILQDLENANCDRLAQGERPILPVSLHYFMREADGQPRAVPPEIVKNTQETLDLLTQRCQNGD